MMSDVRSAVVVDETLLQYVTKTIVQAIDPLQVILFGSYARGTPSAYSDLDLMIVKDRPFSHHMTRRKEMAYVWRLLAHIVIPKDILIYTYDEVAQWRQSKNHVVARALEEGKLLYERPAGNVIDQDGGERSQSSERNE